MPSAVVAVTVTVWPLAADRVTVNVAVPAASDTVTSPIDTVGAASLSVIVPTPTPSAINAFVGADRFSVNDSGASSVVSSITATDTVCEVTPGANVSTVPVTAP